MEWVRFGSVSDQSSGFRFVFCCTRNKHGDFRISVTDAADVWAADFSDEDLQTFTQNVSLKSPQELCQKLSSGLVCVEVLEDLARFRSVSGSSPAVLDLTKMAAAAAKQEVKQLLFKMADSLAHSADGAVLTPSPNKNHQRRAAEFEPRQQNSSSLTPTKKRLPGSSLINPGTKRKREATGVAFDDPDED
ncbi:hypothetical protein NL108_016841 [Boleophthalmus pectinirostris]|uniref:protein PAXX n=1 Tax=Boleophthalmus pectinirostris TaxID=150288 RepID=UPI000A1C52D7|nr:protein PAXX [Boleophthalmus pectinirostris]XP_020789588.1 protein PAXX [Boleophthalmus pectinirostris]KAJ0068135.1 hypothetical protein NL108_016841 [Boleophthalmus pectinirostris]